MAKKRLGVGIIGVGFVGKFHIRSWVGVRDSDILGVLSRSEGSAAEGAALCRELGVGDARIFTSVTDMVADPAIDALWICAPNYTRLEIMEEITEAVISGKGELVGIACEKPLGRNAGEAYKLRELVQKAGLLDGFLENQLFTGACRRGTQRPAHALVLGRRVAGWRRNQRHDVPLGGSSTLSPHTTWSKP
jgi:predicted dehydrogenase